MITTSKDRLVSLDLFRGIVMLLLMAEHVHFYYLLTYVAPENHIFNAIVNQFFHHEWNGMHFWDLIQPYFTFIIGIAMAISITKRWDHGESWMHTFKHITFRCLVLFVLGLVIRCCAKQQLVWELWQILSMLAINIFLAFLFFRFRDSNKLIISFGLLILTEMMYRLFTVDGFDQPFVKDHNFGAYVDMVLMGKLHKHGWVFIDFLPTTAHAIWGVVTGNLLIGTRKNTEKLRILILAGLAGVTVGYGMDLLNITPINKHLSTSSFMIASGGLCLLTFAPLYWLVDIKGYKKWTVFFTIVGMNPIFIYIFSRTVGKYWFHGSVAVFVKGFMNRLTASEGIVNLTTYIAILGLEWYLCYWLYKKRIYIKI